MEHPLERFIHDLTLLAPAVGQGAYAFIDSEKHCRGWVQFIICSERRVEIHRLWTLQPGKGNGSMMLKTLCELADRHGIEMVLIPTPIGRKPHPRTGKQLQAWYQKYGFSMSKKKMIRMPAMPLA